METKFNKLKEIDKTKTPFKVPENYFAQFNEEIINRLPEREIIKPQVITMWDRVKPWVYMAAMFVGMYVVINFLIKEKNKSSNIADYQNVPEQTLTGSPQVDNYWSTVQITEEEFYQYLEEQMINDGYFDYMYKQYYLN
ncbi:MULTISPECIES: hypothetical protein [Proteiniphilum]|jgi:hypothetical protein|uniref:hypothetical protein n=1 Tax=Proteiniphilum TaxID=294702 RepID=UPI001EECDF23|nr:MULTISPECIES: hypothetical protein [Proteiniphilum]ULB33899.1 hypothetical protein KDN43_13030 [Proteiniphilum propionicum]